MFIKYILEEEGSEEHFHCYESYLLYAFKSGLLNMFYKEVSCPSNCCCPCGISWTMNLIGSTCFLRRGESIGGKSLSNCIYCLSNDVSLHLMRRWWSNFQLLIINPLMKLQLHLECVFTYDSIPWVGISLWKRSDHVNWLNMISNPKISQLSKCFWRL